MVNCNYIVKRHINLQKVELFLTKCKENGHV